jgi:asparagine N-glycosylation enzyme membrane subunit Stt3
MKRLRLFALACFAIAMLLYAAAWMPGAIGFGVLGLVFEIVGWWDLFSADRSDEA